MLILYILEELCATSVNKLCIADPYFYILGNNQYVGLIFLRIKKINPTRIPLKTTWIAYKQGYKNLISLML